MRVAVGNGADGVGELRGDGHAGVVDGQVKLLPQEEFKCHVRERTEFVKIDAGG